MKLKFIALAICVLAIGQSAPAQENTKTFLYQKLIDRQPNRLKTNVVGSYPQKIRESHWSNEEGWQLLQILSISYNGKGDPLEILYDLGETYTRKLFSYTETGYETGILEQYLEDGAWINFRHQTWDYQGPDNKRTSIVYRMEVWDNGTWVLQDGQIEEYEYYQNGQLGMVIYSVYDNGLGAWLPRERNLYFYQEDDAFYDWVWIYLNNGDWFMYQKWEMTWRTQLDFDVVISERSTEAGQDWLIVGKLSLYMENSNYIITDFSYDSATETFRANSRTRIPADIHGNSTGNYIEASLDNGTNWILEIGVNYNLTYSGDNLVERITEEYNIYESPYWHLAVMEEFSDFASLSTDPVLTLEPQLILAPNPAGEVLTIRMINPGSGRISVDIYSLTGQKVLSEARQLAGNTAEVTIPCGNLSPGTYLLDARDSSGGVIGRQLLVKQ